MNYELSEEQRAFAQSARDFALAELAPHAAHWDAEGIFPKETIARSGELGFCGLYAPESIGGLALLPRGAQVIPHRQTEEILAGAGGGVTVVIQGANIRSELECEIIVFRPTFAAFFAAIT